MPLVSCTVLINTKGPTYPGGQQIFSMGSIILNSSESMLLLKTKGCPILISLITAISHLALPPTASLHSKTENRLRGSSSFSITTSLQTNASKRTTSSVLASYPVQKSHGMQTPLFYCLWKNYLSLQLVCLHTMPSCAASSPSMPILSLLLVTFLPFQCLCT